MILGQLETSIFLKVARHLSIAQVESGVGQNGGSLGRIVVARNHAHPKSGSKTSNNTGNGVCVVDGQEGTTKSGGCGATVALDLDVLLLAVGADAGSGYTGLAVQKERVGRVGIFRHLEGAVSLFFSDADIILLISNHAIGLIERLERAAGAGQVLKAVGGGFPRCFAFNIINLDFPSSGSSSVGAS